MIIRENNFFVSNCKISIDNLSCNQTLAIITIEITKYANVIVVAKDGILLNL